MATDRRFALRIVTEEPTIGANDVFTTISELEAVKSGYDNLVIDCEGMPFEKVTTLFCEWATDADAALYLLTNIDLGMFTGLGLDLEVAVASATAALRKMIHRNGSTRSLWAECRRWVAGLPGIKEGDEIEATVTAKGTTHTFKGIYVEPKKAK